jgi:acetyl esterase/lipase
MTREDHAETNFSPGSDVRRRLRQSRPQTKRQALLLGGILLATVVVATLLTYVADPSPLAHLPDRLESGRDVAYGANEYHRLDIVYDLDCSRLRPALVMIHEGGWLEGDKSSYHPLMVEYAQLGYVTVTINFRPSGVARFPAAVEDCKLAVRWLRAHAAGYGVDAERIGVMGWSSGAHLAMMIALTDESIGLEGDGPFQGVSSRVQAAVCVSGVYDLLLEEKGDFPNSENDPAIVWFLGGTPRQKRELARRASPVAYLSRDDPPVLVLHGEKDPRIDAEQARQFALALQAIGRKDAVVLLPGDGHGTDVLPRDPQQRRRVREFFARNLRPD